jgi:phage shock protein A
MGGISIQGEEVMADATIDRLIANLQDMVADLKNLQMAIRRKDGETRRLHAALQAAEQAASAARSVGTDLSAVAVANGFGRRPRRRSSVSR